MLILALETSSELCEIALADERGILTSHTYRHGMHLSERLIGDIQALLTEIGKSLDDVELIAVDIGPGSFMGIRIGVMTAKTLADSLRIPLCGISSLRIAAHAYHYLKGWTIMPIMHARADILHSQLFQSGGNELEALEEIKMRTLDEIVDALTQNNSTPGILCGEGLNRYGDQLQQILTRENAKAHFGRADAPGAHLLAELAFIKASAGQTDDPLHHVGADITPPQITAPRVKPANTISSQ
jgi:tRNA threonylcarbamoyladenosine biosynthesis protein TsaB